ncbi:DoxX family protein [Brachybacterium hainanense]|uniref:DoxX family protein n=1 Tax=Brachybacterium hainanense TaxID=1541174 RepID=A0ABV6RAP5_9MICO
MTALEWFLWILTWALGLAFAAGALGQLLLPKERYRAVGKSQEWTDDFSTAQLRGIGAIKMLGAIGLLLPAVTGILPILSPLAACGLALFMAGAATERYRRGEGAFMAGDVAFVLAFAFLAWGRFVLAPHGA